MKILILIICIILLNSSAMFAQQTKAKNDYSQVVSSQLVKSADEYKKIADKKTADASFASGNFLQALTEYTFLLSTYAWNKSMTVGIYSKKGLCYQALNRYDLALEAFQECIELDPGKWEHHYNIAEVYRKAGLTEQAMAEYKKVLELEGDKFPTYLSLGDIYQAMGFNNDAIENYKQALIIKSSADLYRKLSGCYERLHQYTVASSMLKQAISLEPGVSNDYIELAWVYYMDNKFDEAIKSLLTAGEKEPDRKDIQLNILAAYIKKGDMAAANNLIRKLLELYPEDPLIYFSAGFIAYLQKEMVPAGIYFTKSSQLAKTPVLKEYSEYFSKNLDMQSEKR